MRRKKLIQLRKDNRWTQQDVVELLNENEEVNITASFYGMIERGERNPSLYLAKSISNLFNKTIEQVFFTQNNNNVLAKVG